MTNRVRICSLKNITYIIIFCSAPSYIKYWRKIAFMNHIFFLSNLVRAQMKFLYPSKTMAGVTFLLFQ